MKISDISIGTVTAALIYLSAAFQVGFYNTIGEEFLWAMSPGDMVLSLVAAGAPLLGYTVAILYLAKQIAKWTIFGSSTFTKWVELGYLPSIPGWVLYLLFIYIILVLQRNVPGSGIWVTLVHALMVLGLCVLIWREAIENEYIEFSSLGWLAIGVWLATSNLGSLYGAIGGRVCSFQFSDQRTLKAILLRPLSDAYLVRLRNSTYVWSKSKIDEVSCSLDENTLDNRIMLMRPAGK